MKILDHVSLDVDRVVLVVDVLPFQAAAFAPPHTGGDDQLEIGFVLDALILQSLDQLLYRFLVCNDLFLLFPRIFVGPPRRIVVEKTALHRIGEESTQAGVDSLNRILGERLSRILTCLLPQFSIELAKMLLTEIY